MPAEELFVTVDDRPAGQLVREGTDYVFSYIPGAEPKHFVSLLMPVRARPYVWPGELHPPFQMSVPEGLLKHRLLAEFGKLGYTDDMGLLALTGRSRIGRVRFLTLSAAFSSSKRVPPRLDLQGLVEHGNAQALFDDLMEVYAQDSGIAGVQPKFIARSDDDPLTMPVGTHIVKSSGMATPFLAANEWLCLQAAQRAGLRVPEHTLSVDGQVITIRRFDVTEDELLGFEEACALQGKGTADKYQGSYESMTKGLLGFVAPDALADARDQIFRSLVLTGLVRNGDAHLKNFGVLYRDEEDVWYAPTYDIVSTQAYEQYRNDVPALTLGGRRAWWQRKQLLLFARTQLHMSDAQANERIEAVAQAVVEIGATEIPRLIREVPGFRETGKRMLRLWDLSLREFLAGSAKSKITKKVTSPLNEVIEREKLSDWKPRAGVASRKQPKLR